MRRRGKIGLAILALALAGGGAYVGMERPRPPLVIRVAAQQEEAVQAAAQEEAPRILIYHTHTYEAYEITETETYTPTEKWRTRDEQYNMVAVGDALARELTARGFIVVHDTTAFEPPNLSTAYTRSLEMLKRDWIRASNTIIGSTCIATRTAGRTTAETALRSMGRASRM